MITMPLEIRRALLLACGVALVASCARGPTRVPSAAVDYARGAPRMTLSLPATGVGYSGMVLAAAEADGSPIALAAVAAGPAAQAGLTPDDRIVAVNGQTITQAALAAQLAAARPGARLRLTVVRDEVAREVEFEIDDRARWLGPALLPPRVAARAALPAPAPDGFAVALAAAGANPAVTTLHQRLIEAFDALARVDLGRHKLPLTRAALRDPMQLVQWQAGRRAALATAAGPGIVETFCTTLALPCPPPAPAPDVNALPTLVAYLTALVSEVQQVFASAPRALLDPDLRYLVEQTASGRLIHGQAQAQRAIGLMQASLHVDRARLLEAFAGLLELAAVLPAVTVTTDQPPPAALLAQVEGAISAWAPLGDGYLVIGGSAANRYRMRSLHAVLDRGGDDVYEWDAELPAALQLIVDLSGDDRYEASYGGPGSGWLGLAVLHDHDGDDRYRSVFGGCGAGLLGFGALIDGNGRDRYRCDAWSNGAGLYGAGALLDQGDFADAYHSQFASQGAGGPDGVGVLFDAGGADLYRANGLVDSVYATPAVFAAFSQGVGYGLRPHDHGGVGLLLDGGGDDRYEGGEFSQGGGYFWGVGVLADAAGNDLYFGNRYAQGFAAHQAVGLLQDLAGDDHYWSMTAAGQGAAWDQSAALLHDAAGNDVYRAGALSQGAAAHQSRAALHDAAGDDAYWSDSVVAQGAAGSNAYHLDLADPIYSVGLLADEGGDDRYTRPLAAGALRIDLVEPPGPAGTGLAGVASDRD